MNIKEARRLYKKVRDGDSIVDCDYMWVDICEALDRRIARLEAEKNGDMDRC